MTVDKLKGGEEVWGLEALHTALSSTVMGISAWVTVSQSPEAMEN